MADECVTREVQDRFSAECRKKGIVLGAVACYKARIKICPPPDVNPTVERGADGIVNIIPPWYYRGCDVTPALAPYPPSAPMPNEAAAELAYERLAAQAQKQSLEVMHLKSRASRARKIEVGLGFWLGAGLCGVGAVALYLRR